MLTRVDHLVLAVRDLEAAVAQTSALLGRGPSARGRHPGAGTANALYQLENTGLELLAPDGEGGVGELLRRRLEQAGPGLSALCFGCEDADALAVAWQAAGLDPAPVGVGEARNDDGSLRRWRHVFLPVEHTRGVALFGIQRLRDSAPLEPVAPAGAAAAAVHAIDHVVVRSPDADAASGLYGGRLGIRLALDRSFPQWGVRLLFFRLGGLTLEVASALDASPDAGAADELWGVSYRVADVAAARERLAAEGFDVSEVRAGRRPGTRVFSVRGEPLGVATLVLGPDEGDPRR